jgi:hypothetical protein
MTKKNLELAVYISAAMLAIGVFLPLTELPVYGGVSYNKISSIESYLVVLLALSGPTFIFLDKIKLLKFSPIGAWLVLLFPAIKSLFKSGDSSFLGETVSEASSVMQDFAGNLFLNIFDFSWGGFVFLIGLIVFSISSVIRSVK